jgi:hypothetical protein
MVTSGLTVAVGPLALVTVVVTVCVHPLASVITQV